MLVQPRPIAAPIAIPEPDRLVETTTGERATIGGKGQALDVVGEPARPEQGAALDVPQFDAPIPAPGRQRAPFRAEGEGPHRVGMRLPGQMQELPFFAPHTYFPAPAAR